MKSLFTLCKIIAMVAVFNVANFTPAHANVLQPSTNLTGNIGISLVAPGGLTQDGGATVTNVNLHDTTIVSAADGVLISPVPFVDCSTIADCMQPSEQISLSGDTFSLSIYAGSPYGSNNPTTQAITGYLGANGKPAEYEFTGLTIPGQTITGLLVTSSYSDLANTIDLNSLVNLTDPNGFSVNLDRLIFNNPPGQGNSLDHLELSVELVTSPVP
jgi:hypothetical protein